jgi:S1-C subfamily serine protease
VAVAALAALVGGGVGAGTVLLVGGDDDPARTVVQQAPVGDRTGDGDGALTPAAIYRRDAPGVVYIKATVVRRTQSPYVFGPVEERGESTGTGFVIDRDGTIVTNAHVVENATAVTVRFADQKTAPAEVRGTDPSTDLAVLRVDPKGLALRPLALGTSSDVEVGDPTVAIGNPFGLDLTLTTGVVSAKQRRIDAPNGFQIDDVLQTDAAINPGNSGGPLIDAAGRVIGVNSAIRTGGNGEGSIGIGFAVPIDTVKRVVPQLRKGGKVERAYLGIESGTVEPSFNLATDRGAYVQDVLPATPAERGGIRPGDIIVRIGDREVATTEDVTAAVEESKVGDTVPVAVVRGGEEQTLQVRLTARPDLPAPLPSDP